MLEFLKRRLKSEKGAMDKILVTLLLVIVGVGAVVGLNSWIGTETDTVKSSATTKITEVTGDASGGWFWTFAKKRRFYLLFFFEKGLNYVHNSLLYIFLFSSIFRL